MRKTFETPEPTSLYVELGSGDLNIHAEPISETTVTVDGKGAEEVIVEQRGDEIVVQAPPRRTGFFTTGGGDLTVTIVLPLDSDVAAKVGSADLSGSGRFGTTRIKSGSGDVSLEELAGEGQVESGSGDVEIDTASGDVRIKTGSGDVSVDRTGRAATVSTGSGDVELGTTAGDLQAKSASGDVTVKHALADLALSTASGDLYIGRAERGAISLKNVSGDIRVGIPDGIPVWTDISCLTGNVFSSLQGAGQPAEGQDYIELRAKTVSGDIHLDQL